MENKETITVVDENGNERVAEVIATFNSEKFNKNYVVYTYNETHKEDMVKIYAATLVEHEDNYSFENIESDEEWEDVKEFLKELAKEA